MYRGMHGSQAELARAVAYAQQEPFAGLAKTSTRAYKKRVFIVFCVYCINKQNMFYCLYKHPPPVFCQPRPFVMTGTLRDNLLIAQPGDTDAAPACKNRY